MGDQNPPSDAERIGNYLAELKGRAVGVFDIGTRGARLIVGPSDAPGTIEKKTFSMVGRRPNLGLYVNEDDRHLPLDTRSLQFVAHFISEWRQFLNEHGVTDISLITTAWFRWLNNQDEVRRFLAERTGLEIESISQQRETRLSLFSLPILMDRWVGRIQPPEIADEDTVAIVDQGGGSLEISWMRWGDRHQPKVDFEMVAFPTLGTVALRRDFFQLRKNLFSRTRPEDNKTYIANQVSRIKKKARDVLGSNPELPTARGCKPGKLHLFGLGSAITDVVSGGPYDRHNKFVTPDRLDQQLRRKLAALDANNEQVRSIWRGMYAPADQQTDASAKWASRKGELDEILTSLFGVPVYQEMLAQSATKGITVSGYGLGFGYYFDKQLSGPKPNMVDMDDRGPYVFISYCRADQDEVEAEIDLLRALKTRIWYDRDASGKFGDLLAHKISASAAVIVFLTENSAKSEWVQDEIAFATKKRKRIIPIYLERTKLRGGMDMSLTRFDAIHRMNLDESGYRRKIERAVPKRCRL